MRTKCLLPALAIALASAAAFAEVAPEETGHSAKLSESWSPHAFWASDLLLRRSALFDADSGQMLGALDAGQDLSPVRPLRSAARRELYVASTYYARRSHGERTDALVIYDATTLAPIAEVALPAKKASNAHGIAIVALLDDGRFALVFNQTPANSVSVVDLAERRLASEIETGGCALVYPAGPRRFGMLCVDGTALAITLDERGAETSRSASAKFFDAARDPVTEKGVRLGDGRWLFASFEGMAHEVDFAANGGPAAKPAWSLFSDTERDDGWRIGGHLHLAFHAASGLLYSLVHQGEADSHKQAGTELWVYDVAKRTKQRAIEIPNVSAAALRSLLDLPEGGAVDWILQRVVPNAGADCVLVTPDDEPRIVLSNQEAPVIAVLDAQSGELLREIEEPGIAIGLLAAP
ncbi:MAG TPA: amine dehydrogenase large subunit [Myxococcota bacterium]|nr:amine dehydrogenase large subunit [Myxococcota bacterium]